MADIRSSQIIAQVEYQEPDLLKVTQVIAQVEYAITPEGWIGKIIGVTNPAKIMGITVADISKVMGIE